MAKFNFVEASSKGYRFTWEQRNFLAHYGLWPVMLKISTFVLITALGLEKNLLRQGLMLLPAYFLEGWLVAIAIRFAIFGETRPEPLNSKAGDQSPEAAHRRRCIMAGIVVYMLIKLFTSFLGGMVMTADAIEAPANPPPPTPGGFLTLIGILVFAIWSFRLMWLHIPMIMDYRVMKFIKRIDGFAASFCMLGLWMICMVPIMIIMIGFANILDLILPGHAGDVPSTLATHALAALQAVVETIIAIIANVAMAYGIREILTTHENSRH